MMFDSLNKIRERRGRFANLDFQKYLLESQGIFKR